MSDDLYQDAILARAKSGARSGRLEAPDASVTLDNPLCGDRVTIDLKFDAQGRIGDVAQHVRGCALCHASAAVIGAHAVGADRGAVDELAARLHAMLAGSAEPPSGVWAELAMFLPARAHKSRHDCVMLPFEALRKALAAAQLSRDQKSRAARVAP